jgi:hypothetical protein
MNISLVEKVIEFLTLQLNGLRKNLAVTRAKVSQQEFSAAIGHAWTTWLEKGVASDLDLETFTRILCNLKPSLVAVGSGAIEGSPQLLQPPLLAISEQDLHTLSCIISKIKKQITLHNASSTNKLGTEVNSRVVPAKCYDYWFRECAKIAQKRDNRGINSGEGSEHDIVDDLVHQKLASRADPHCFAYFNFKSHMIFTGHEDLKNLLLRAFRQETKEGSAQSGIRKLQVLAMGEALVPVEVTEQMKRVLAKCNGHSGCNEIGGHDNHDDINDNKEDQGYSKKQCFVDLATLSTATVQQPFHARYSTRSANASQG